MTNTISRSQAKARTLGAQLASGVFVLCAVALGIVGLPEPGSGASILTTNNALGDLPGPAGGSNAQPDLPADTPIDASRSTPIDTFGLALRFALLDNAPEIVQETQDQVEPIGDDDNETNDNSGEIVKRVRYIGFINDPTTRHAFIRIDGKQRIVSLGQIAKAGVPEFPDLTIERITPNHIFVTDGENRARIKLATRSGQSITMVDGGSVEVVKASENGSLLTAEDEAKILAMPARQQPLARRRLERERRGLSPDKERRRPVAEPLGTMRGSLNRNRQNRND